MIEEAFFPELQSFFSNFSFYNNSLVFYFDSVYFINLKILKFLAQYFSTLTLVFDNCSFHAVKEKLEVTEREEFIDLLINSFNPQIIKFKFDVLDVEEAPLFQHYVLFDKRAKNQAKTILQDLIN
mmetsp:Transcript_21021/g.18645  ORF Transcript_21021/g.18645 Transcript_21021/m.18645 type:complete len:125 (-) Transcript_21021:42-416(-)